jgi:hypothetical protein
MYVCTTHPNLITFIISKLKSNYTYGTSLTFHSYYLVCSYVSCNKWTCIWSKLYCPTEAGNGNIYINAVHNKVQGLDHGNLESHET